MKCILLVISLALFTPGCKSITEMRITTLQRSHHYVKRDQREHHEGIGLAFRDRSGAMFLTGKYTNSEGDPGTYYGVLAPMLRTGQCRPYGGVLSAQGYGRDSEPLGDVFPIYPTSPTILLDCHVYKGFSVDFSLLPGVIGLSFSYPIYP